MKNTWTIKKVLEWTIDYFNRHDVPEYRLSAEILLAHVLRLKRIDLYLQFERILTPEELAKYREFIQRRIKFEPIEYITGEQEFMGLKFKITPDVLIPRTETELLVENVLDNLQQHPKQSRKILDIGTGSGVIAISIAHFCEYCHVTGIDLSEKVIGIARENAQLNEVENISFLVQDALNINSDFIQQYDMILMNPPYVSEQDYINLHSQVRDYEPRSALFAGEEGLDFYRHFIPTVKTRLKDQATIFMEIGYNQKEEIEKLLSHQNFKSIEFFQDYSKIDRIVKAQK